MTRIVFIFIIIFLILWFWQMWGNGDNNGGGGDGGDSGGDGRNKCIRVDAVNGQVINYNLWKNHYYPPSWDKKLCTPANFNGSYRQQTNNMPIDQTMSPSLQKHYNQELMTADVAPFMVQCRRRDITGQVLIGHS